jgi:hypothetical protein
MASKKAGKKYRNGGDTDLVKFKKRSKGGATSGKSYEHN